jgi:hypothetical protein
MAMGRGLSQVQREMLESIGYELMGYRNELERMEAEGVPDVRARGPGWERQARHISLQRLLHWGAK